MIQFNELGMKEYRRTAQIKIQENTRELSGKNTFKLSNRPPQFGESLNITQIQNFNRMAQLQIQNKLSTIFDIFHIKALTKIDQAFQQIKIADDVYMNVYSNQKNVQQLMNGFIQKIETFITIKTVKNMGNFINHLKALNNKSRNQNSKREMLRVNSRMERLYDDFQLLDRNNSHDGNSQKTNKMLHKRKEKNEKQMSIFKLQMEQLLSVHQNYLRKKN